MITENEDWTPRNRYDESGDSSDGQRTKRPYQANNRGNYGNNYRKPDNNYNQQDGGYNRPAGNYNRPRPAYNRPQGGYNNDRPNNYDRQGGGYNNDRPNNYDRQGGGYNNDRPNNYDRQGDYRPRPRTYDNYQPRYYNNQQDNSDARKRRPRVGEGAEPIRNTNYANRPQTGYNNQQGGYQQRPQGNRYTGQRPDFGGTRKPFVRGTQQIPLQKKTNKYREENFDPNEELRINKYLANAGMCSRRDADEYIKAGMVKVNGKVVSELGSKVKRSDEVRFHDELVKLEQKVYVLLNKPRNCVTTADDPQERLTVMDMVKSACHERIFPVGRLDRNTTGVLLLTNDGELSSKLTHPKYLKKKIYHVWLDKPATVEDMQKLADGIELEDGEIHVDAISYVSDEDKNQVGVEIHSGRNRVVRRMFEKLNYHVTKLDRVYFAGLTKKNLKRGQWRYLTDKEVNLLRMGAFD
ncbi:MAG: pseudouridine synthase [Dysgonamonadaceae bacterium]|jgi:23S rRNA pseudouridine2605 synthase|nr:pseudouridine synthase [Dysgonamonadaceae bacterium]